MLILGIESSCDDTSVALLDITDEKIEILAEKTASQIDVHKKYGGVVPEIAGRKHAEKILPIIEEVLAEAQKTIMDEFGNYGDVSSMPHEKQNSHNQNYHNTPQIRPDVIAVTSGPGLITGLVVGVETAKTLSYLWNVPIVAVNHIEGHFHSVKVESRKSKVESDSYPILSLIASGGHTELILSTKQGRYERIGGTRDDAAGECFDKAAKMLGLEYPGGPKISQFAAQGNPNAIKFPRPMLDSHNYDMSFAGLKTAALYWLQDNAEKKDSSFLIPHSSFLNDFCASFEQAIIDVLVTKTMKAVVEYKPKTIILAGGVSANKKLRETLETQIKQHSPLSSFLFPLLTYCMDNAAMIAVTAYTHAKQKEFTPWDKLEADPNWKIYNSKVE